MKKDIKFVCTKERGHAIRLAEDFLNDGYDYIISVGGQEKKN